MAAPQDRTARRTLTDAQPANLADTRTPASSGAAGIAAQSPQSAYLTAARELDGAGRYAEARDVLVRCLELHPACAAAYAQLAGVLDRTGFAAEASLCCDQALAIAPRDADALIALASGFVDAGLNGAAARAYRAALELRPLDAATWNDLGLALVALGQVHAAEPAYLQAIGIAPHLAQPHVNLGELLRAGGDYARAAERYRTAVGLRPDWAEAWNNLGVVARGLGSSGEAMAALRRATELRPDYAEAHFNLGNAFNAAGQEDEARARYRHALKLRPSHAESVFNLASLEQSPAEAIALYTGALAARPDYPAARAGLVAAMLKACRWDGLDAWIERVHEDVARRPDAEIAPMQFLQISHDPALQLVCARNWTQHRVLPLARRFAAPPPAARGERSRLHVGYLSADFRNHAVGHLVEELFEAHDRAGFEIFGYDIGRDDGSRVRRRIEAGMDRFAGVRELSTPDLAERVRADGIDILVDLTGYTEHSRTEVLALRPAPVQVSYLGFPGSMGAQFIDYIIGDATLTPPAMQACYAERLALLPRCYQVSPSSGPIAPIPQRREVGLPDDALVFCCFNNTYKILPAMFDSWMRLLHQVPGSVLWLARSNAAAETALRSEAARRGVDSARLVFAPLVELDAHLARLPLADIFLDTAPYTAGATASVTLRAGVPLVTLAGRTYVGRMAASLLHALHLPQLVAPDPAAYEAIALRLAHDADERAALRQQIAHGVRELFDVPRFARELERLYQDMWTRGPREPADEGLAGT